jgi:hypothetical protein
MAAKYEFSPTATRVKATGNREIAAPGDGGAGRCRILLRGRTRPSGRVVDFDNVQFSGKKPVCQINSAPFIFTFFPSGFQKIQSQRLDWHLDGSKNGECKGVLRATVNASGLWSFDDNALGGCTITGSLQTAPPVTVVSK